MSIRAYIAELKEYNTEIKRLRDHMSSLKHKADDVKKKIADYLTEKEQDGVKYNDTAVILESKEKRAGKKVKDKDGDAMKVLSSYGVPNPKEALERILEARKGPLVERQEVKLKPIKKLTK